MMKKVSSFRFPVFAGRSLIAALVLLCAASGEAQSRLYLRSAISVMGTVARAGTSYGCYNSPQTHLWRVLATTSGTETSSAFAPSSTAPPCLQQTATSSGQFMRWISPPLSAAINLTGNYDYSVKCAESAAQLNLGYRMVVRRWNHVKRGVDLVLDTGAAIGTECGGSVYTVAAHSPTCGSSCNLAVGDRIVVDVELQAVGGSWAGNGSRTATLYYEGANTFANFAQTISFGTDQAGYLQGITSP